MNRKLVNSSIGLSIRSNRNILMLCVSIDDPAIRHTFTIVIHTHLHSRINLRKCVYTQMFSGFVIYPSPGKLLFPLNLLFYRRTIQTQHFGTITMWCYPWISLIEHFRSSQICGESHRFSFSKFFLPLKLKCHIWIRLYRCKRLGQIFPHYILFQPYSPTKAFRGARNARQSLQSAERELFIIKWDG